MDESELPIQACILDQASALAGQDALYEERLWRTSDSLRFTCCVRAGRLTSKVVAIDSAISTHALDAIAPSAREAMIEREWRRIRESLLASIRDPGSSAWRELTGGGAHGPR